MKLYTFWRSIATFRVRIALNLKGITPETETIDILTGHQHTGGYDAVNPQKLLPALILDDGGPPLFQSMAIMEYLEEAHPHPPLLPADPRGRARVRGLSLIAVADAHPLSVPRVRNYLGQTLKLDQSEVAAWIRHWQTEALGALESHLAEREGDRPPLPRRQRHARRHLSRRRRWSARSTSRWTSKRFRPWRASTTPACRTTPLRARIRCASPERRPRCRIDVAAACRVGKGARTRAVPTRVWSTWARAACAALCPPHALTSAPHAQRRNRRARLVGQAARPRGRGKPAHPIQPRRDARARAGARVRGRE